MAITIRNTLSRPQIKSSDKQYISIPPIHPGRILVERYMQPFGLSANALAVALKVPATRIHEIIKERRAITPDTAMRLAYYFAEDPRFWLDLQADYDLSLLALESTIEQQVKPREKSIRRIFQQ